MALTKVNRGGLNTGISDSSDATFLTVTSGEGATFAGTLAVTGVHTIGNNAVATSEGGANTINVAQGLVKAWHRTHNGGAMAPDSFGFSSVTDTAVGKYKPTFSIVMNNTLYVVVLGGDNKNDGANGHVFNIDDAVNQATDSYQCIFNSVTSFGTVDCNQNASSVVCGDLA